MINVFDLLKTILVTETSNFRFGYTETNIQRRYKTKQIFFFLLARDGKKKTACADSPLLDGLKHYRHS